MDFNKFSKNIEKIFDWLPGSWQQSAFSGNRCTAQFPIPQVRVPSHSSSLSQSPSWIPHLLWIVQQLQELPLPLQVSWPLQLVAASHATIKDEKEWRPVLFRFEFLPAVSHIKTKSSDTNEVEIEASEDCQSEQDWVENMSDQNPTLELHKQNIVYV